VAQAGVLRQQQLIPAKQSPNTAVQQLTASQEGTTAEAKTSRAGSQPLAQS